MTTQQDLLDAQVALCRAETDTAKRSLIAMHADLTLKILNDKHASTGRSVAAASAEATEILRASAKATTQQDFWALKDAAA